MSVRTRFAPSPTGYMHIGGMRTALFNWLYARRHGGQFLLRIDDTDAERNIMEAVGPILKAFRWMGLDWDEGPEVGGPCGPYFQSQRSSLYREAADQLLASGHAYRCFETPDQIAADRDAAQKEGRQYLNARRSLGLSAAEVERKLAEGQPWVLRLLVPRDRKIELNDEIRGHVEWDAGLMADPVIMRSNGSPLYNFATVVDDAQMRITHVIRAEEHLSNTPTQLLIYEALGHTPPTFAHIPFVTAPGTKEKISKRKLEQYRKSPHFKVLFDIGDAVFPKLGWTERDQVNPVIIEYYEKLGFLPAGLLNALARIGWSFDDQTELMSREFLISNFSLERVVKGPAALDPDKMLSYQAHWMSQLSLDEKVAGCAPYLQKAGLLPADLSVDQTQRVAAVVSSLGERIKLFSDILTYDYFFRDPIEINEKEFAKRVQKEGVPELLAGFREVLATVPDSEWTVTRLEEKLKAFAEARGTGAGNIIHALRISTTGSPIGPGVYDCLVLVGRETVLHRIDAALARCRS